MTKNPSPKLLTLVILLSWMSSCAPAPALTATASPGNTPTASATAIPTPTPAIDEKVREALVVAIGEQEYGELEASIGPNGEIKGVDYEAGKDSKFEGIVDPHTITARETSDMLSPVIVTAEAKNKNGATLKVVWNDEHNRWVNVTQVGTDLLDQEKHIRFNNVDRKPTSPSDDRSDTMIGSGDLGRIMLALGLGELPDEATTPQFWVNVEETQLMYKDKLLIDFF